MLKFLLFLITIKSNILAQTVSFQDPNLEDGIRNNLKIGYSKSITQLMLNSLTSLNLSGYGIENIEGIQNCKNIEKIDLSSNNIIDVHHLASLANLKYINLRENEISDINTLATLKNCVIFIDKNNIQSLPILHSSNTIEGLENQKKTKDLGNFNFTLRPEILDANTKKVRIYYRSGSDSNNNAILNVGDKRKDTDPLDFGIYNVISDGQLRYIDHSYNSQGTITLSMYYLINDSQVSRISNSFILKQNKSTLKSNVTEIKLNSGYTKTIELSLLNGSSLEANTRIVGADASNFTVNTTSVNLIRNSTQLLNISFSGSNSGGKTATLEIYDTSGVILAIPLIGNLQINDACLSASVSSVDIPTGNTNTPSDYFFTLTNQSSINSITVTNVQFTGTDAQYFSYDAQLFKVPQTINRSISTGFAVKVLNTQNQSRTYNATLQLTTNNSLCPTFTIPVSSHYLQSNLSFLSPADGYVYIMDPSSDGLELKWQGQIPGSDPFNISVDIEYAVNGGTWNLIPSTISCQVAHNNNNPYNIKTISYQDLSSLNLIGKNVQFRIRPCNLSNPWQYSGYVKFVAPNSKPIEITSPNGNEVFTAGEIKKIIWNDYVGFNTVDLFYSTNYGSSFIPIASGVSAKNGFYDWTVPNGINSDNCIVKVVAQNVYDESDYKFFIQTPPVPITITNTTISAEGCNTNPAGSIRVDFTGGTPPFISYYYTGTTSATISGYTTNTNFSFANLQSNNYNIILLDALGKRHLIKNLFVPKKDDYGYLLNTVPDICSGGKGKLDINVSGRFTNPFSVTLKKNGTQIFQGEQKSFNNLVVGTYIAEVTPSDGCLYSEEFTISTTPGTYFPITPTVTNTSCSGSTGAISLNVGTAQKPTYLWSNGATTQNLTALSAGQYSVNVTDATGCVQTQKYEVFEEGSFIESSITSNQVNNDLSLSAGFLYFQTPVNSLEKIRVLNVLNNSYTDFTIPSYYNSSVTKKVENLTVKNNFLYGVVKETNNNVTQVHFIKVDLNTKNIINRVIYNQNKSFAKIMFENDRLYALNRTTLEICNFNLGTVKSVNIPLNNNAYNFIFDLSRMKIYIVGWETQISEFDINTETIVRNATTNVRASQVNLNSNELYIVGNTPSVSNTVVQKFDLSTFTSGPVTTLRNIMVNNYGQNFIKENRYLYIPYLSPGQIDIFDTQTLQFKNIPISKYCENIIYSSQNDKIYIGSSGQGLTQLINNKFDFTTSKTDATCGLNNGSVKLTIPNDGKTYTYLWSNGVKTKDVSNLSAGDYTVTVTQTGGCSVRKTITIAQTNVAFTASVSPNNGNICPNTTLSLVSSVGKSYVWYKDNLVISGATNQTYSASVAGNYKVVVTNSNNCIATSSVVPVTIIPNPVANFTSTVSGNTVTFTNTSSNGNQYLWNFGDGSTDTQFSPIKTYANKNNTYSVNLKTTNQCGASNEVSKKIVISCISTATISGTQSISAGQSATLSVALTGTSPWAIVVNGVTYNNITTSPYTFSVMPNATTTYTLSSVSNSCGAGTTSGSAVVTVNACTPPTVTNVERCGAGTVTLTPSGCTGTYNWYSASTGGNALASTATFTTPVLAQTTNYYVSCTTNKCTSSRTLATATIKAVPTAPTLTASASTINLGQSTTLTATNCSGTITWDNNLGTGSPKTVSPKTNTSYKATCTTNNCESAASEININVNIPPTVTGTATICKGTSTTLTATGCSGTITWSDATTGTSKSVSPTSTTSYTATCTINNVKSANSNAVTVTVNPVPTAPTLTASASTINIGQSTTLTATNCSGTVTWDNNLGTGSPKTVSPKTNTTYKATCSTNNCVSTTSEISINVNTPPTITGTATICKGASTTLTATGCTGTVTWNDATTGISKSVTPATTTSYTATCTVNNVKSANSNTVTVTVNPVPNAPTLTASASTINLGLSTILTASNCSGTITWDNNLGTGSPKTVSPKTNTTYKATCTINNCVSTASSIAINVNTPPTITGTATICKGASSNLTATGCNGTLTWSDATTGTNKTVAPVSTTSYTATCTLNNVKSANSNAVTITVNPVPNAPTLTASASTINLGLSTILTATNCNGTITWDNNLGTGSPKTVSPKINTTYKATCTTNNCVSTPSSIAINVNTPPTITGTTTICKGASTTLTATGCNGTLTWSDNGTGTSRNVTPTSTTTYTAICTVNNVKSANSNAVTVTVNPVPTAPTLTASASTINLLGQSTILTASNCSGTVTWDNNLGTGSPKTVSPKINTTYKATCTTNNCVSTPSSIAINVNTPPAITGTATICKGGITTLTATGCSGTITWSDGTTGTSKSVTPVSTTTYTATCTVNNVKSANSNAVTVTVNPVPNASTLTASASTINLGQSTILTASNCSGTVTWDNNLGTGSPKTVSPKANTTYKATCTTNNCVSTPSSVAINVNTPPSITGTATICKGTSTTLTATACNGTVTWNDGTTGTSKTVAPTSTTSYTATCTVNNVKSANSNAVTVTVNPVPNAPTLTASASTINLGQSATLTATNCSGTVTWDNALGTGTSKIIKPIISTNYVATCTVNGCVSNTSSVYVTVTPANSSSPSIGTYTNCGTGSVTATCGNYLLGTIRAKVTKIVSGYAYVEVSKCNGTAFAADGSAIARISSLCGTQTATASIAKGVYTANLQIPVALGTSTFYIVVHSSTTDKFTAGSITINLNNNTSRVSSEEYALNEKNDEFVTYPNPAITDFKIKFGDNHKKDEKIALSIFDIWGAEMIKHNNSTVDEIEREPIDVKGFKAGTYILKVQFTDSQKVYYKKINVIN